MITDDTILEQLHWQLFDNSKSHSLAVQKFEDILSYVFAGLDITNFSIQKDGIEIKRWGSGRCFKSIHLSFWDNFEKRKCFRCIEFKGTAKDFKAKVLEKFEALKSLKQEADAKYENRKNAEKASETVIAELTKIVKEKFEKYAVKITQCENGYRLNLEIYFNNKSELLKFCDKGVA